MLKIKKTSQFDRSLKKLLKKRNLKLQELAKVIDILASNTKLPVKYRNHKLRGKLNKIWECHIHRDVLLLHYTIDQREELILYDLRTHDRLNRT